MAGGHTALTPLDPNLPLLASQAAIEIDRFIRQQQTDFIATKRLAVLLQNTVQRSPGPVVTFYLTDPTAVALMSTTFDLTKLAPQIRTVDELAMEASRIATSLETTEASDNPRALRAFCAALSECAAVYIRSVHTQQPSHPYRR